MNHIRNSLARLRPLERCILSTHTHDLHPANLLHFVPDLPPEQAFIGPVDKPTQFLPKRSNSLRKARKVEARRPAAGECEWEMRHLKAVSLTELDKHDQGRFEAERVAWTRV